MERFKRWSVYAAAVGIWWGGQALADYTLPTASGNRTFGTFVSGITNFLKHVLVDPSGNQVGTSSNPVMATVQAGGNTVTVSAGGALSGNLSQLNGAVISASNPVPEQRSLGGTAVGPGNPSPVQLSQGAAVLSNSNALPMVPVVGGAAVSTTNRVPAVSTVATPVTYSYSATLNLPANYQDTIVLQGSSTKVVKLTAAGVSVWSACGASWFRLEKHSSFGTGGSTPTIPKNDPGDSASATAVIRSYGDAATTTGTIVGTYRSANVVYEGVQWTFGDGGISKPIVLRGTGEYVAISGMSANGLCSSAFPWFEWTEE
jgi:hypothetical protein